MLGRYQNFPTTVHGIARLSHSFSTEKLQRIIIEAFHQLNLETCDVNAVTPRSPACEVGFEFGIAEGVTFSYLDEEELRRFEGAIESEATPILDFLCVVRYYTVDEKGKRVPLKFDYHLLRFLFGKDSAEVRIYHERGTQRVPMEDLISFIIKRINRGLSRRRLRPLATSYLWAL